jgi:4-hydroxyproline epimerase
MNPIERIRVVDSHTGGEPTRVVLEGGPDLGHGPLAERLARFRRQHDHLRSAMVCEPRGSDTVVGALLTPPTDPNCVAGVIYFNNVGYLGMCGHGTIGLVATLAWLGRIGPGVHRIETPVGVVAAELAADGMVHVENVPAYRHAHDVTVRLDDGDTVRGDVAWGGNWFFLVREPQRELRLADVEALTQYTWRIRQALTRAGIAGADGGEIDHIELFCASAQADSRNFVLCPGKAYDRSPCGTGTSAKLACLAADAKLAPGAIWRQESIVGSVFEASYRREGERIVARIGGRAHIMGEGHLILAPDDPFRHGIR